MAQPHMLNAMAHRDAKHRRGSYAYLGWRRLMTATAVCWLMACGTGFAMLVFFDAEAIASSSYASMEELRNALSTWQWVQRFHLWSSVGAVALSIISAAWAIVSKWRPVMAPAALTAAAAILAFASGRRANWDEMAFFAIFDESIFAFAPTAGPRLRAAEFSSVGLATRDYRIEFWLHNAVLPVLGVALLIGGALALRALSAARR